MLSNIFRRRCWFDGRDIAKEPGVNADGIACRIYRNEAGELQPFPSLAVIQNALAERHQLKKGAGWQSALAAFPAVGFSLLPKLTCPACWPAYAGVLTAMGLGFVDYTPYLLPLTANFLAVTLLLLGVSARSRHDHRPLLLGSAASAVTLIGKFAFDSDIALYSGIALLVVASFWNAWPIRPSTGDCPACSGTVKA